MLLKMKSKSRLSSVTLEKGQIWRLEDSHIQIVEIGKNLTHYKRFNSLKQKGVPTKLERTRAVEEYLKAQRATLVSK
jgi:hypothetical protein